jgi:hypothetical protein
VSSVDERVSSSDEDDARVVNDRARFDNVIETDVTPDIVIGVVVALRVGVLRVGVATRTVAQLLRIIVVVVIILVVGGGGGADVVAFCRRARINEAQKHNHCVTVYPYEK